MKQTEEWNTAKSRIENQIKELRHRLHTCPEISGQERKTKAALKQFLEESTNLELHDCGGGFYAVYRSSTADSAKKGVAFRADYDALALPEGGAAHLCGHDGHASALCGAALLLEQQVKEGRDPGRNVYFLFQPAEETGAGAAPCCELFDKEEIEEIYGAHNLPGFAFGELYTKEGTFACGSEGLTLRFIGKPTHEAYPERGADLKKLCQMVLTRAEELAAQDGLILETEEQDVFPATENDSACAKKVLKVCGGRILQEPMRWSEDFGHYLNHCRGAFFGIGAGVEHPGLHTETYEYPDGLLMRTAESFLKLI